MPVAAAMPATMAMTAVAIFLAFGLAIPLPLFPAVKPVFIARVIAKTGTPAIITSAVIHLIILARIMRP